MFHGCKPPENQKDRLCKSCPGQLESPEPGRSEQASHKLSGCAFRAASAMASCASHPDLAIGAGNLSPGILDRWPWVKTVLGSHFGVGEFTTHLRTYFGGGIGIFTGGAGSLQDFDPWPYL